jgi:hypothetical protein
VFERKSQHQAFALQSESDEVADGTDRVFMLCREGVWPLGPERDCACELVASLDGRAKSGLDSGSQ